MKNSISYSQNFLKDKNLVLKLIENSSTTKNDVVFEIGAGEGIITELLLKKAKNVIAFEIDKLLFNKLLQKFKSNTSLTLIK